MSKWRKRASVSVYAVALAGAAVAAGNAKADQVIPDDLIVQGSLCVGFDCINNESFGFDTIRLKENNTRITFMDTSASPFPTRDWSLVANSSNSGGQNYFGIRDCGDTSSGLSECGTRVFSVQAGAASESIFVASTGRVGFRTAAPVLDLHVRTGNTPGQRLEQDGSSGFSPQTWDIAGNEANFFVRDVTGGSRLPFRIRPGAPTSSIDIANTGNVGIGTASPNTRLHVVASAGAAANVLRLENNGNPELVFENTNVGTLWEISSGLSFLVRQEGGANLFTLANDGNLTITGGLVTGTAGSCTAAAPCDLVFDPSSYEIPSIDEHAKLMWEKKHLPAVGPVRAGEPLNVTVTLTRVLNELEVAHVYIEQLHRRLAELENTQQ